MSTLFLGLLAVVAIAVGSFEGGINSYIHFHSFLLVVGGTGAIFLISTPLQTTLILLKSTLSLFRPSDSFGSYEKVIQALLKNKETPVNCPHPLVLYAGELWRQGIEPNLFITLLSQRRNEMNSKSVEAVNAVRNLAKYPPALGMTGTVMGMINLFAGLDTKKDMIGANLSIAMTATFLGLILANLIIAPLGDRLQVQHTTGERLTESLYEVLLLLNRGESAAVIREEVLSRAA